MKRISAHEHPASPFRRTSSRQAKAPCCHRSSSLGSERASSAHLKLNYSRFTHRPGVDGRCQTWAVGGRRLLRRERPDRPLRAPNSAGEADGVGDVALRVAPVDVADEGRIDVVAEQLLERSGSSAMTSRGTARMWFSWGPEPGRDVLEDDAEARPVGVVGPTAVPDAPGVEDHRASGHHGANHLVALLRGAVGPTMAAGDEAGGAVVSVKSSRAHMVLTTTFGKSSGSG